MTNEKTGLYKKVLNLRKISCSLWVKNDERFAEELEGKKGR